MSIQGTINQAFGTAAQGATAIKALKTQDPEYQAAKAKEIEQRDIESNLATNRAIQQELIKRTNKRGASEVELAGSTSEAGKLYRELQGEELNLSKRALYNNPSAESLQDYADSAIWNKFTQVLYDRQRQKQANQKATKQAQAKAEQKQAILSNINKWGETNEPRESKLITDVNKWGTK